MKGTVRTLVFAALLLAPWPATAQPVFPPLFAGAGYDQGGRAHAGAEAWFVHVDGEQRGHAYEVLAGVKLDGTAKLGTGVAWMAGEDLGAFVFADARAWAYLETSAGGTLGGGVDVGLGAGLARVLLRVGYGLAGTADRPRRRGVTAAVSWRLWP